MQTLGMAYLIKQDGFYTPGLEECIQIICVGYGFVKGNHDP